MPLLNVRLGEEDARRATALRRAGVEISSIVREALRVEYERRIAASRAGRPSALVTDILASLPDESPAPAPPAVDRLALKRRVREKLTRKRA